MGVRRWLVRWCPSGCVEVSRVISFFMVQRSHSDFATERYIYPQIVHIFLTGATTPQDAILGVRIRDLAYKYL